MTKKKAKKTKKKAKKKTAKSKKLKGWQEFDLGESGRDLNWGLIAHTDHPSFRLQFLDGDNFLTLRLPTTMLVNLAVEAIKASNLQNFRMRNDKKKGHWDIHLNAGRKGDITECFTA